MAMNAKVLLPFGIAITLAACGGETQRITVRRDGAPAALDEVAKNLFAADYRYSPSWWQTAICLPDDWQKTLLSKEGDLLYDYVDSPSGFATRVSVGIGNLQGLTGAQSMANPRVPIVETVLSGPDGKELMRWLALPSPSGANAS
jgi:hypothetical protein